MQIVIHDALDIIRSLDALVALGKKSIHSIEKSVGESIDCIEISRQ